MLKEAGAKRWEGSFRLARCLEEGREELAGSWGRHARPGAIWG